MESRLDANVVSSSLPCTVIGWSRSPPSMAWISSLSWTMYFTMPRLPQRKKRGKDARQMMSRRN